MRKNLVVVAGGKTSQHIQWIGDIDRNFDIFLIDYEKCWEDNEHLAYYYHRSGGMKYWLLSSIDVYTRLHKLYDSIWIADDDLKITTKSVNKMFEIFKTFELDLAQPALTNDSPFTFPITRERDNCILHFTNFIEVMAPIFSKKSYELLYPTFNLNKTSWGLDYLWPNLLGYPKTKIAVIDATPMLHYRPLRFDKGQEEWNDLTKIFTDHPTIQKNQREIGKIQVSIYE